jgi:Ca2+/Na+ antiporter
VTNEGKGGEIILNKIEGKHNTNNKFMYFFKNQLLNNFTLVIFALFLAIVLVRFLGEENDLFLRWGAIISILFIGILIMRQTAKVIEETTDVLKDRTGLAGGFLQSFGTAFPDMVLGVVAAILSLQARSTDILRAVNIAIIAAATTFGSNIYNVLFSTWCIFRQNISDKKNKIVTIFPFFKNGGKVTPLKKHKIKPTLIEIETAISIIIYLTILTSVVAVSMVLFGQVQAPAGFKGTLYQLIRPIGVFILLLCILILYHFRKNKRPKSLVPEIAEEERYYAKKSGFRIFFDLILAGIAILFTAEAMVKAVENFCLITRIPFVLAGVLIGVIACLGEMMTIYQFVINPKGRIGDAVVGIVMDNVLTILGASIVAIMGGIFLGSNSLILIFVIVLMSNTLLIGQVSKLKDTLLKSI